MQIDKWQHEIWKAKCWISSFSYLILWYILTNQLSSDGLLKCFHMSKQNFPFNLFHQIVSSWVYFISAFPSFHIYMAIWIHYLQAHILYPGNKIVFLIKFETAKYSLLIYLLTGVFCCFNLYVLHSLTKSIVLCWPKSIPMCSLLCTYMLNLASPTFFCIYDTGNILT